VFFATGWFYGKVGREDRGAFELGRAVDGVANSVPDHDDDDVIIFVVL